MTEKKTPEYNLEDIKNAFSKADRLRMTVSAKQGQISIGFTNEEVVNAIQSLTAKDFYKAMAPRHPSFTAWQDIYKTRFKHIELYIKFQMSARGELILSFKEK
jgi:Mg/Co/Ni transporter MgtE